MPTRKGYIFILTILLVVFFSELNGTEERKTAKGSGTLQLDPRFKPHLGTSYYVFELNGVNIGTGSISLQKNGRLYKIHYEARTNKNIDSICKARYRGDGILDIDPLKPVRAVLQERVRSKAKETAIYFEENGRIITAETKKEKGRETKNKTSEIHIDGMVLDPLSAVLLLQGIEWEAGKEKVLTVYTGKSSYETRFACVDKACLEVLGVKRHTWVITQTSRKLDKDPEEQIEKKQPSLRIYVSAEGYPDVIKVETTRTFGHVTLTLCRFEPALEKTPH